MKSMKSGKFYKILTEQATVIADCEPDRLGYVIQEDDMSVPTESLLQQLFTHNGPRAFRMFKGVKVVNIVNDSSIGDIHTLLVRVTNIKRRDDEPAEDIRFYVVKAHDTTSALAVVYDIHRASAKESIEIAVLRPLSVITIKEGQVEAEGVDYLWWTETLDESKKLGRKELMQEERNKLMQERYPMRSLHSVFKEETTEEEPDGPEETDEPTQEDDSSSDDESDS